MDTRAIIGLLAALFLTSPALLTGTFASNVTFTVGGDKNWMVPVANSGLNYTVWAQNVTARVGDSLYFKYNPDGHNVRQVNATVYKACDTGATPLHEWDTGDTTVFLQDAGAQYFMCGAPGHCILGQAFVLDVLPATAPSPTSVLSPPGNAAAPSNVIHHTLAWAVVYGFGTTVFHLSSSVLS